MAAGVGSRLRPITDKKPKTLVEVNGRPMISVIIEALAQAGIFEIVICTGYRADQIEQYLESEYSDLVNLKYISNTAYETTNNMYSLYLAKEYLHGDCFILNADLVFDASIIEAMVAAEGSVVSVDKGFYLDEAMKLKVDNNGFVESISKNIEKSEAYGSSIDVYKFTSLDVAIIRDSVATIIEESGDWNQWTEVLFDQLFSLGKIQARPLNIAGQRWFEIDNFEDLQAAEILFNDHLRKLRSKTAYVLDKDGTLTIGDAPIPGADDFVTALQDLGKKILIGSNNSSRSSPDHSSRISECLSLQKQVGVIGSLDTAIDYLKNQGVKSICPFANQKVKKELSKIFSVTMEKPDCVLLTYHNEFTYDELVKFCRVISSGCDYYATHTDVVCPTELGPIPDIGSFIEMIYWSTGRKPKRNFGKPERIFIEAALDRLGAEEEGTVLVGDRLYTDIKGCERTRVTSVLVLTGETSRVDYEFSDVRADIVVSSLGQLMPYI